MKISFSIFERTLLMNVTLKSLLLMRRIISRLMFIEETEKIPIDFPTTFPFRMEFLIAGSIVKIILFFSEKFIKEISKE